MSNQIKETGLSKIKNRVHSCGITHPKPFYSTVESLALRDRVNRYLDKKMEEWAATVPYANHLEGSEVHSAWYRRHTMEHVWRIRLSRTVQASVLHAMAKISPEAAQLYARYQDEEMLHDVLYARDLGPLGIDEEELYATEPMFATRLLEGFLYFIAQHENPLGVVCYGYLVEYTTKKLTPRQLEAMKKSIGSDKIKGQVAHLNTDLVEDHSGAMWNIMNSLIFSAEDEALIYKYFDEIQELLAMYFKELYSKTVGEPIK